MDWVLRDRGFLPTPDPLTHFKGAGFAQAEELGRALPDLVYRKQFRDTAPKALGDPSRWPFPTSAGHEAERLFLLFSYFASAYVHAPGLPTVARLPAEIAVPLVRVAELCSRPPILSYASYCLHNWRRIDPARQIALGNIELMQNFSTPGEGKGDEDWFILVHVEIEAQAAPVLTALRSLSTVLPSNDANQLADVLERVRAGVNSMNRTLDRMPEGCSPDVYFRKVRPYIFGFTDIVYEGCVDPGPRSYRGETGAQSSIIPTLLMGLGIQHKSSLLTQHLSDMRTYMPSPHRRFIEEQVSVRDHVIRLAPGNGGQRLKGVYNASLEEVVAFRQRHLEYAVNYIHKKVDNPLATGGTPYMPWLHQLIEETKEHFLA